MKTKFKITLFNLGLTILKACDNATQAAKLARREIYSRTGKTAKPADYSVSVHN